MATTVTPSTLTVTLTETYQLNGVSYGNAQSKTITAQGQVDQRVMEIAGKGEEGLTFTNIIAFGTADQAGKVVKADYAYFRITNLDDTNNLILRLYNAVDYLYFNVEPSESFMLLSNEIDATTAAGVVSFADITEIAGASSSATASIDIEYIVVTA